MDEKDYRLIKVLKALANGIRFQILMFLLEKPMTVQELRRKLRRSESSVSHHLKTLRDADLARFETEGPYVRYFTKRREIIEHVMELREVVRRQM